MNPMTLFTPKEFQVAHKTVKTFCKTVAGPSGPWLRLKMSVELLEGATYQTLAPLISRFGRPGG